MSTDATLTAARVRALRPPRDPPDPWHPLAVHEEAELAPEGVVSAATLFLAGAECPFTCVFCDLWRHTLAGPTPAGAIPAQIEEGRGRLRATAEVLKLYNASNFFDDRAVPAEDDEAILAQLRGVPRVVVECHPRLVGERARRFAARLEGTLEVAMGLETTDPRAFDRLGKAAGLDDFVRAAELLAATGADVRVFLLVGLPWVPAPEQVEAVVGSARFAAAELGARHVSLIPLRQGNGAVELLAARGELAAPSLALLEESLDRCRAEVPGPVFCADLWDTADLATCSCAPERLARLARLNLGEAHEPRVVCTLCST